MFSFCFNAREELIAGSRDLENKSYFFITNTCKTLSIYEIFEINQITNITKYKTKVPYIANYSAFFIILGRVFENLKQ